MILGHFGSLFELFLTTSGIPVNIFYKTLDFRLFYIIFEIAVKIIYQREKKMLICRSPYHKVFQIRFRVHTPDKTKAYLYAEEEILFNAVDSFILSLRIKKRKFTTLAPREGYNDEGKYLEKIIEVLVPKNKKENEEIIWVK